MRILGLTLAAALVTALLPTHASAQVMCQPMPTKPKSCVDWVCKTNAPWCHVSNGLGVAGGCVAWKCNAVARKR